MPVIIFQDGVNNSYYIKCQILGSVASKIIDLNAKINAKDPESFRANRELMLKHTTYLKMKLDASKGREFNDIIESSEKLCFNFEKGGKSLQNGHFLSRYP